MQPKVSIIVPLYNTELYVESCLDSLVNQGYSNYEIIVVDDGSTDSSYEVVNNYIAQNQITNCRLLLKANGGLSDARNFGIEHCAVDSEYVVFVDSDDRLSKDCISALVSNSGQDTLAIGSLLRCHADNIPTKIRGHSVSVYNTPWSNEEFIRLLPSGIINSACAKCYSLKVIRDSDLRFEKTLPEDTLFNISYLSKVNQVKHITGAVYYYLIWPNSMSTKPHERIFQNYLRIQRQLYDTVSAGLHKYIDRFVYPQYRVNTQNFLRQGNTEIPDRYLRKPLIRRTFDSYRAVSPADWVLNKALRYRLWPLAKFIISHAR